MLRRLVLLVAAAGAVAVAVKELAPDVRRYLKLREM